MKSDFVETLMLGSDYIATIAGILFYQKKNATALLGHYNFYQDLSFLSQLTALELNYLKHLGEKYQIEPLQKVEHYAINAPYFFHTDQYDLLLGRKIGDNLLECARKIPELFNVEEILASPPIELEKQHERYIHDFSLKLLQVPVSKWGEDFFKDELNHFDFIKKITNVKNWRSDDFQKTMRLLVGVYENFIPKRLDKLYCYFHFLNMISPFYLLDVERLNRDLLDVYQEMGGLFLEDDVDDFFIKGKKIKGVKLSELNRTFHFETLYGIGTPKRSLNIEASMPKNAYFSVDFIFNNRSAFPEKGLGYFHYYSREKWLGTSIQRLFIQYFPNKVLASFIIAPKLEESFGSSLIDHLQQELEFAFRRIGFKGKYVQAPYFINEYDWHYREESPRGMKKALSEKLDIDYLWKGEKKYRFSNVKYIGQYNPKPMGKVSLFHKIENLL